MHFFLVKVEKDAAHYVDTEPVMYVHPPTSTILPPLPPSGDQYLPFPSVHPPSPIPSPSFIPPPPPSLLSLLHPPPPLLHSPPPLPSFLLPLLHPLPLPLLHCSSPSYTPPPPLLHPLPLLHCSSSLSPFIPGCPLRKLITLNCLKRPLMDTLLWS